MAVYKTQITFSNQTQPYADLTVDFMNGPTVVPGSGPPAPGTVLNWAGPNGSGGIVFSGGGDEGQAIFFGFAQFPDQGPVGYSGQLISS